MSIRREFGRCPRNPLAGFTLIELLVTIALIGIISAVVLLSIGLRGDDDRMEKEARRLGSLIELATDEATLQGRDYGLEIMLNGYRFVEHDQLLEQWHEVIGDDTLRPRPIAEPMEFVLFLEDRRVELDADAAETVGEDEDNEDGDTRLRDLDRNRNRNRDRSDDYLPHILILSSGDVTPFELKILSPPGDAEVTMTMSLLGELEIETDDQKDF